MKPLQQNTTELPPAARVDVKAMLAAEIVDAVKTADHYLVSLFLGRGQFEKLPPLKSLPIAREAAGHLENIYRNGRKAMVYAITPDGRSVFIPPDYQPNGEPPMIALNSTNLNAGHPAGDGIPDFLNRKAPAVTVVSTDAPKTSVAGPRVVCSNSLTAAPVTPAEIEATKTKRKRNRKGGARKPAATPKAKAKTPRAAKAAKAPKPGTRARYNWVAAADAAKKGKMPPLPDFSADTHKNYRPKLEKVQELAKAGDIKALKALECPTYDSSAIAVARYRDNCVTALTVQAKS